MAAWDRALTGRGPRLCRPSPGQPPALPAYRPSGAERRVQREQPSARLTVSPHCAQVWTPAPPPALTSSPFPMM